MNARPAVVLLSGGLDSTTTLGHAIAEGWTAYALSIDYGQRQQEELVRARTIARTVGAVEHRVIRVDLGSFGGSALTTDAPVPKNRRDIGNDIPPTYVPARNTVFLSLALAWAEVVGARGPERRRGAQPTTPQNDRRPCVHRTTIGPAPP
jgi:7-cyano-7-deazaguanine synthase